MAETETTKLVESGEEAKPSSQVQAEISLSVYEMKSPDMGVPLQRVFYSMLAVMALWVIVALAASFVYTP